MSAPLILGIDEAGRGCAIGPMVVCGVLATPDALPALQAIGVKDSKQLSPSARQALADAICRMAADVRLVFVPAKQIDEARRLGSGALNKLEADAYAEIILETNPSVAYMDLPQVTGRKQGSPENTAFCRLLRRLIGPQVRIVLENRADQKFPIVMAASIVAKVNRDAAIARLREKFGDFGSGYPSDPKTRAWLASYFARHGHLPDCVRHTWKTVAEILQGKFTI